jgi:hypothetical protein
MNEFEKNQRVAEEICRTRQWQGQTFPQGEYVLLLDGEVFALCESLDRAMQTFNETGAEPNRGMVFEVADPVIDVIR